MTANGKLEAEKKFLVLKEHIKKTGGLAVAFSGGTDSSFLLKAAQEVLGERVLAITADSCFFPEREKTAAEEFCKKEGIRQVLLNIGILQVEGVKENPRNRCYLCKRALFEKIIQTAAENGFAHVAEGSNMDDLSDERPGLRAIQELQVKSPLREAGLYKEEIRFLSRQMGIAAWCRPSFACLASRFVYGEEITKEKLSMVERAEQLLFEMGFCQVRVRLHGSMARIEILPEEFEKIMEESCRERIIRQFSEYGFTYTALDLKGYRTGSMNLGKEKGQLQ